MCLVTDRQRLAAGSERERFDELVRLIEAAARAGVDLIQVRERDLDARTLASLTERCVRAVEGAGAHVLVNDRLDVALATGAAGVHLRSDSFDAERVRRVAPPGFLVGRSVHGAAEAVAVASGGALDYLILGTVFPSASKPADLTPAGVAELVRAARSLSVPVLAIGGVTAERFPEVAGTGAAGVAAIGLFLGLRRAAAPDALREVVAAARRAFEASC